MTPKIIRQLLEAPLVRLGRCTVCDRRTVFGTRRPTLIPLRGCLLCVRCKSRGRNRHVALLAARHLNLEALGDLRDRTDVTVLNTSHTSAIGRCLADLDHVYNTGFWPDRERGATQDGVRCEDLTALTFADASLNLVITEDVMEHVPDSDKAFREIHRVLKPGGAHVFTIPFRLDRPTQQRFSVHDGSFVLNEPIRYHTDPGREKIPVFHDYGYTLFADLAACGFTTSAVRSNLVDSRRYGVVDCLTFVSVAN